MEKRERDDARDRRELSACDDGGQNCWAKKQTLALDFRLAPGPSQDDADVESPGGGRSWDVERELSGLTGDPMNSDIFRVPAEFRLIEMVDLLRAKTYFIRRANKAFVICGLAGSYFGKAALGVDLAKIFQK